MHATYIDYEEEESRANFSVSFHHGVFWQCAWIIQFLNPKVSSF